VPPGSDHCEVLVDWGASGARYPLLVDPLWTFAGDMIDDRELHQVVVLANGKALAVGGDDGVNDLASAELYDPASKTWGATESLPAGEQRENFAATVLSDGRAIVIGGSGSDSTGSTVTLSSVWIYDPTLGHWSSTGGLLKPRSDITATVLNN